MRLVLLFAGMLGAGVLASCGAKGVSATEDRPASCPSDANQVNPGGPCSEVDLACSYVAPSCDCGYGAGPCSRITATLTCAANHTWSHALAYDGCSCPGPWPTLGAACETPTADGSEVTCTYDDGCTGAYTFACADGVWAAATLTGGWRRLPCPPPPPPG
jgi:hypothetical protein